MKKLLISGGAYGDIPLIKAARKLGFYVITTGNRPHELGHRYSDKYIEADYSNKETLLELAIQNKIDAICPSCSDISAVSSAYVAEKLNLPGHDSYEIALLIHNKDRFRRFCKKNNILSPAAWDFNNIESALGSISKIEFPAIVKPVDMTGGHGIERVDDVTGLKNAIVQAFNASKTGRIVIEEFIDGTYHGCSTFIRNGRVVFWYYDDEYYYNNKYRVAATSTPSIVSADVVKALNQQIESIASVLQLKDGIFHVQFILKDAKAYIVDVCRRLPGDLYPIIVEYATGVDYSSYVVKFFTGMDCTDLIQKETHGFYARSNVLSRQPGIVEELLIDESIRNNIIDKYIWVRKGDLIDNIKIPKFGLVFFKFDSMEEMIGKMKVMPDLLTLRVK